MKARKTILALVLPAMFILTALTASAATINVPADYTTIQAAVDAAVNGDTVSVAAGTYTENIDFSGKLITVQSADGPETTIIDGNASGSVVVFQSGEDNTAVLDGFGVTNGTGNVITEIHETYTLGGGILAYNSSPTIQNCHIYENEASYGAGIDCENADSIIIDNCQITDNDGYAAGVGISMSGCDSPSIMDCYIKNNRSIGTYIVFGGAINLHTSSPTIDNCTVDDNYAYYGGGIYCSYTCTPIITNSTITNNSTAGNQGDGGISVRKAGCYLEINNCVISFNEGGVKAWEGAEVLITKTSVEGNIYAGIRIGNSSLDASIATIEKCYITGNGTGIYTESSSSQTLVITNSVISRSTGTGIYCQRDSIITNCTIVDQAGSGLYLNGYAHDITNSIIWGNSGSGQISGSGTANVTYSDVEGGWSGTGNIDDDPLLFDSSHLTDTSPCIDVGTATGAPAEDIDEETRPQGTGIDMGADEYSGPTPIFDYGDAPDPDYPTLIASNGACHTIVSGHYLGAFVDYDVDGQPTPNAAGDDNDGKDDEDGVVFSPPLAVPCSQISVTITASSSGYIDAWIDFNNDGDWGDAGEQIFTSQAVIAGDNNMNFTVPCDAVLGVSFARFRFSSVGGLSYTGLADDGEVEDYGILISDTSSHVYPGVAAGNKHTVGLKTNGMVVAVGDNTDNQCEVNTWAGITQVTAGPYHTVGLRYDGTVVAAAPDGGSYDHDQCEGVSSWTGITHVAAGYWHTIGLKSDGTVVAVGENNYGQCNVSSWSGITQVDGGGSHTVGLKTDGTVVAIGMNSQGQCDVGTWTNVEQVAAGAGHTVGLKTDGTVVAVGDPSYGCCDVTSWTDIKQVAAGSYLTVGLKSDGTVVAVGENDYGQCDVSSWNDIIYVAAGYKHTVGLKTDGTVVAVGSNSSGQCDVGGWHLGTIPDDISYPNLINWNGNLVADFGDNGMWYHNGTNWNWMTNDGDVGQMVPWNGNLVVDFGADKGLWYYDTSWHWMSNKSDPHMMMAWNNGTDEKLVVDFGAGQRIYTYDGTWNWFKNKDGVADITVWNNKLIVDFGAGRGLYNYDGTWNWMSNKDDVNMMLPWDNGTTERLVVDFGGGRRIYTYDGAWSWFINKDDVNDMTVWNQKLVMDFGGGRCLYNYDTSWHWMNNKDDVARMVPWRGGSDLGVDFGGGRNMYNYNGAWSWIKNVNNVPEMLSWNNRLAVDFGSGVGVYNYNGSWHQMKPWSTAD